MRPLRSLMLGDCDHYLSPYIFGVQQGMTRLGHWHAQVSIRQPIEVIRQRIVDLRPDVLWTHMLLWPPAGSPPVEKLLDVVGKAVLLGARAVIHDGDYKEATRHPHDLSGVFALALCNHTFDRTAWKVPTLRWPYFAFAQEKIADSLPSLRCALFFAGTIGTEPVYSARTNFLKTLRDRGIGLKLADDGNTLFRTPEISSSADAVLGFGRPGATGWVDTRVFQYSGSGGILLHDDASEFLEPGVHFLPYASGDAGSVLDALRRLRAMSAADRRAMRERAFAFVQEKHSSVARVRQALAALGVA